MDRRTLLKSAAASAAMVPFAGIGARAATALRVQLGWIANVEYADHWIALEEGLFEDAGLDVSVTPGGPNAPDPLTMLSAGNADVSYTSWLPLLDAVAKGNEFVIIAARFQASPLGIISLADKPILEPADIVGSKILAQGPKEETAIEATLGLAGLPTDDWTMVPAGFSPEPLVAGDGHGYTAFATNQTITLGQMGLTREKDFHFRTFDELGFPGYAGIATVERSFLAANRPALVAYLAALMKAWRRNDEDGSLAPRLAVEKYGLDYGLDLEQQTRQNELQGEFVRPGGAADYPLFKVDAEKIAGPMYDAARATGRTDLPPVEDIIDPTLAEDALASLS